MTCIYSNCIVCNTQFKNIKGKANKFCGVPCYRSYQREGNYTKPSERIHICTNCNKTITGVSKNKKRNGDACEHVFCNRDCYDQHRLKVSTEPLGNCLNCNSEITKGMTSNPNPKYCCMTCKLEHKKSKDRHCISCGVWFSSLKWNASAGRLVADNFRKTCSNECYIFQIKNNQDRKEKISKAFTGSNHPNWQGGSSYLENRKFRGVEWYSIRNKVLKRDGFKCCHCGINKDEQLNRYGRDFSINHIKPFHQFGGMTELANKMSNLETLCDSCHTKADWKYRKENMMQQVFHF